MGTGGHNVPIIKDKNGIRKLVPIECIRLQGFPKYFSFPPLVNRSNQYKQAGNSVSVSVIEAIAKNILKAICDIDINNIEKPKNTIKLLVFIFLSS